MRRGARGAWMAGAGLLALSLTIVGCKDAQPGAAPDIPAGGAGGAGSGGSGGTATGGSGVTPGPSGSIDTTFGESGFAVVDFGSIDTAWGVGVDGAGRIVLAGNSNAAVSTFALVRLDDAGVPDPGFGTFGLANTSFGNDYDGAEAVMLQPDGRLVAAGTTLSEDVLNGVTGFALARYTDDGSLDSTFGDGGKVVTDLWGTLGSFSLAQEAVLDADGRAIVLGSGTEILLARYTPAGAIDPAFGDEGLATATVGPPETGTVGAHLALDAEGRLLVAGRRIASDSSETPVVARFSGNGTLDTTFGQDGFALVPLPSDGAFSVVAAGPAGSILAAGVSEDQWIVTRFDGAGSPDASFGTAGTAWLGKPAKQPTGLVPIEGDLIVTGTHAGPPTCPCAGTGCDNRCGLFAAVRLDPAGALVPDFANAGLLEIAIGLDDYMSAVVMDAAGRVVVAGHTDFGRGFDFAATRFWP